MRLTFNIKDHKKVYDILIERFGYSPDVFLTDDVIEIDQEDFVNIKTLLPDVYFTKI